MKEVTWVWLKKFQRGKIEEMAAQVKPNGWLCSFCNKGNLGEYPKREDRCPFCGAAVTSSKFG